MGEDIHFRCYLKSRKTGKFVNAHEVCDWNSQYTIFAEMVESRNYDIFSLFGSQRGQYKELSYANYGIPDFLKDSEFDEYCRMCGYYGFIWFTPDSLSKALREYHDRLVDPYKWLDEDSDEFAVWSEFLQTKKIDSEFEKKFMYKYREWLDEHAHIRSWIQETLKGLDKYSDDAYNDVYNKLFDMRQTVFLFFFDC